MLGAQFCVKIIKKGATMEKLILKEGKIIEEKLDLKYYDIDTDAYHERLKSLMDDFSRFEVQPFFQRHYVWGKAQKSNFIDTILKGLTIPAIYTYLDLKTGKEVVIDGQQRLTTIKKFCNNEFKLTGLHSEYLNNLDYFTLPNDLKIKFEHYKVPIIQIKNVSDKSIILEIFEKYNTGGIKLNKQEIRNCVYSGKYNDLIVKLSDYKPFKDVFPDKEVDRMIREEFVLGFLALYQNFAGYNGKLNKFLEEHMNNSLELDNLSDEMFDLKTKTLVNTFKKAVDANIAIFGKNAFKNCIEFNRTKQIMYKTISKQVFFLQMLGVADAPHDLVVRNKEEIKACYENLIIRDADFRPYYKRASKIAMEYRINKWKKAINKIID